MSEAITMLIPDLIAIVEDGSNPSLGLPLRPVRALSIPRGSDVTLLYTIKSRSGSPVNLGVGAPVFTWSVRSDPAAPPLLSVAGQVVAALMGTVKVVITSAQVKALDPIGRGARFVYDAWLKQNNENNQVVPLCPMEITPTASP